MSNRMNLWEKGVGLHGDKTTTVATCIGSLPNVANHERMALRIGDKTTPCPVCGQVGTIITGLDEIMNHGKPTAVDDSEVSCGYPIGSNRVIAPLGPLEALSGIGNVKQIVLSSAVAATNFPIKESISEKEITSIIGRMVIISKRFI